MSIILQLNEVIIAPDRIRRDFDKKKLAELEDSILRLGNIHPPVVRSADNPVLIAGERRFRAIKSLAEKKQGYAADGNELEVGEILVNTLEDLNGIELVEAELEENVCRDNLTPIERAKANARLHELRCQQRGAYSRATKSGQTVTETATEIKGKEANAADVKSLQEDLIIAEHSDDPFVAAAADKREALRIIRDKKKTEHRAKLAQSFDLSRVEHRLIRGDCFELELPSDTYDVILTDPPYGVNMDKVEFWDGSFHEYDDSDEAFKFICDNLPGLTYRIAAEQAHIYVFCDIRRFNDLFAAFTISNWEVWPRPLIWDKGNIGSYGNIEFGFRSTYEAILFANKGKRPTTAAYRDVINVNQSTALPHPAGKPVELYSDLLKRSALPGNKVIDLFCGHGPIFPAAQANRCVATGVELNEKYYNMAVETLSKVKVK
jgi:site-specific DNA-methyltransferase (adenine-specific)